MHVYPYGYMSTLNIFCFPHIFNLFASSRAVGLHHVKSIVKNYKGNGISWEYKISGFKEIICSLSILNAKWRKVWMKGPSAVSAAGFGTQ